MNKDELSEALTMEDPDSTFEFSYSIAPLNLRDDYFLVEVWVKGDLSINADAEDIPRHLSCHVSSLEAAYREISRWATTRARLEKRKRDQEKKSVQGILKIELADDEGVEPNLSWTVFDPERGGEWRAS